MFNRLLIIFGSAFGFLWLSIYLYSYFWGKKKLIRTFKEVDLHNIRDCVDDEIVRIQGKLIPLDDYLTAPLTQRLCSAYTLRASVEVERVSTSGSGTHVRTETAWETLKYIELAQTFLIKCGEYYALIEPTNARLIIHTDKIHDETNYETDKGGFLTDRENEKRRIALEAIGISSRQYTGVYAKNIKLAEGVLELDEEVAVLGSGKWIEVSESIESDYLKSQNIKRVFMVKQTDHQKLFISDSKELLEEFL